MFINPTRHNYKTSGMWWYFQTVFILVVSFWIVWGAGSLFEWSNACSSDFTVTLKRTIPNVCFAFLCAWCILLLCFFWYAGLSHHFNLSLNESFLSPLILFDHNLKESGNDKGTDWLEANFYWNWNELFYSPKATPCLKSASWPYVFIHYNAKISKDTEWKCSGGSVEPNWYVLSNTLQTVSSIRALPV